ncbi:Rz1-like lysis system protein LysC [Shewanella surugensis]|uniref:Rz1-like lysis system protein LysC n=1 Tax=Shewanella surugensis TaxID=212020 RepID=UPI0035E310DF
MRYKIGVIFLCLMMLLSCSSVPPVRTVTVTKTEYVLPPSNMLVPCSVPEYQVETNADLAEYSLILIANLASCEASWQRLNHWVESKR